MLKDRWSHEPERSPAEKLAALASEERRAFLDGLTPQEAEALLRDWRGFLARPSQLPPEGDWDIWMILSGRGFGKTRTGAEYVRELADSGQVKEFGLIGETDRDVRQVMVAGESGLMSVYRETDPNCPVYEPSNRRIRWPNGARANLFNAREPDGLRGHQFEFLWCDELAKWRYVRETWDQAQFCLRLGMNPRCLITTTPRPIELIRSIKAGLECRDQDASRVKVVVGHTSENRANLAPKFLDKIMSKYGGTRLGRQELAGEILGDTPNALWNVRMLDEWRLPETQVKDLKLARTIVAVDPAATSGEDAAWNGIVVVALLEGHEKAVVLTDASLPGRPHEWARRAVAMFDRWQADAVVLETNHGGEMVTDTLRSVRAGLPIIDVKATKGKHVRAEPISSLYEQGRIAHAGHFVELEDQMLLMSSEGYMGEDSPDRLDALVWGLTELFRDMIAVDIVPHRRHRERPRLRVI